ncbi:MAG TPA: MBL fold metallo-hydrolase [Gemmataceae bacterium]|jgi:phosphoribosyl 1,2-cyclic phosphodiesterase
MSLRFTVLASGSAGNASLVEAGGFGVLLDAGIGPRILAQRLAAVEASWNHIHALLLTHTHSDHWKETTLVHIARRSIPIYCHEDHHDYLSSGSIAFARLAEAGLVRLFEASEEIQLSPGLRCRPIPVRHDSGATFGFRFDGVPDLFGHASALAYLADLGCWDDGLADAVADVDLLALEFNHDVEMERCSGRMPQLIARVLGEEGHLSNEQAVALVREVLRRSTPGRLQYLVQLHLSRECNRPALAQAAARAALGRLTSSGKVVTASHDRPSCTFHLGGTAMRRAKVSSHRRSGRAAAASAQQFLPGVELA